MEKKPREEDKRGDGGDTEGENEKETRGRTGETVRFLSRVTSKCGQREMSR